MKPVEKGVKFLFNKDELKEASCCRFCGIGAVETSEKCGEFVSIYEKIVAHESGDESKSITLDVAINKYLPITVSNQELYYPRVICSQCDQTLEITINFFRKIAEGQKILTKIINNCGSAAAVVEPENDLEKLQFSSENPVVLAPKRRGRPRKNPTDSKKLPVQNNLNESNPGDATCFRPKRQSRPPMRYADDDTNQSNDIVIKQEKEDGPEENQNNGEDYFTFFTNGLAEGTAEKSQQQWRWSGQKQTPTLQTDSGNVLSGTIGAEFTTLSRNDNLMDLSKLSVIMDGDEDLDSSSNPGINLETSALITIESNVLPTPDELTNKDRIQLSSQTNAYILNNLLDGGSGTKDNDDGSSVLLSSSLPFEKNDLTGDHEDSDDSVKTVDFVINKKLKRGRKKLKRTSTKSSRKKLQCEVCKKEFSHPSSIAYHRISAHAEEKKFVCSICNKAFSHRQLLANHSSVHSDNKRFKCTLCPAKFKNRASLYTHNKSIHAANKGFTCEECGLQFNLKSSLKAHLRLHTGEKPFSCEFCEKRFSQRSNMAEHRRIHTGEKPHKCNFPNCTKSFTTASQLRNHKVTHTGTKQYLCSVCGKGFIHAENFKYHMRRHTGDPSSNQGKQKKAQLSSATNPTAAAATSQVISDEMEQGTTIIATDQVEAVPPVIGATEQIENVTDFSSTDDGYVQILNTENLTNLETVTQDGQQVIYLYPEDLSYYTITLADSQYTLI